jgi:D-3-phosphoglycerate dehydrogenase
MRLIVCDPLAPAAVEAMHAAGIKVDVRDNITPEDLEAVIADYDAMVVRSRTKVRQPLIDKAVNLKLVVRSGVGLDNIDVKHARSKGIEVRNTPAASSNAVAELTLGYLFALARQIPQMAVSMKDGQWEKKGFSKGMELEGKTLGLIGCGRIGSLVARKALDELLRRADFISLHVPYTEETHFILCQEEFAKMKDGAHIINCGRGGTVNEDALYDAIVSGKVAGAALDVFHDEKEDRGKKLLALPQVIGSPHVGAGTVEASKRVGAEVAQIAIEFAGR